MYVKCWASEYLGNVRISSGDHIHGSKTLKFDCIVLKNNVFAFLPLNDNMVVRAYVDAINARQFDNNNLAIAFHLIYGNFETIIEIKSCKSSLPKNFKRVSTEQLKT